MKSKSKHFSIIDKAFSVEGTVSAKGQLIIKGSVKGKLEAENVIIAEEGDVRADADVVRMTIGGAFEGHIRASEELVILSTGKCAGKITCKNFVVDAGGMLNAEVSCLRDQAEGAQKIPLRLEKIEKKS